MSGCTCLSTQLICFHKRPYTQGTLERTCYCCLFVETFTAFIQENFGNKYFYCIVNLQSIRLFSFYLLSIISHRTLYTFSYISWFKQYFFRVPCLCELILLFIWVNWASSDRISVNLWRAQTLVLHSTLIPLNPRKLQFWILASIIHHLLYQCRNHETWECSSASGAESGSLKF